MNITSTTSFTDIKARRTLARGLLLGFSFLLLQACAHSQLIEQADLLQQNKQYELAVDHYRQALEIRPNNTTTLEKLSNAELAFKDWLSQLRPIADNAFLNNQNGKALLLYGKLALHSNDPDVTGRYETLLENLTAFSQLYVEVNYDPVIFGFNLENDINDLIPLSTQSITANPLIKNEQYAHFEFKQGTFSIKELEDYEFGEYISGYHFVDNPELLNLQRQIPNIRHRLRESRYDVDRYRDAVRVSEATVARLENENSNNGNNRNRHNENTEDTDSTESNQNSSSEHESALNEARRRLNRQQRRLHQHRRELEERRRDLDYKLIQISYLPLTVREDIYSEHRYNVTHSTLNLDGELLISSSNEMAQQPLLASSFDIYHDAQPILELPLNPLEHKSDFALELELNALARSKARQYLNDMVLNYRQSLLASANQLSRPSQRLEAWVIYGLSGRSGVSPSIANKMLSQLQQEIGQGGELSINRLLHP